MVNFIIICIAKLLTILIIEDEPDIRQLISFNLKKIFYKVLIAINGEEGLTITKKHKPDIVILDLMLPGIHGLEVCRILKNKDTKNSNHNVNCAWSRRKYN